MSAQPTFSAIKAKLAAFRFCEACEVDILAQHWLQEHSVAEAPENRNAGVRA
jgi:hypothetical protein